MREIMIAVDLQNDFVGGCLGSSQAQEAARIAAEKIRAFPGEVIFTLDTHSENYLSTQEGTRLPVPHCIKGTDGWQLCPEIAALQKDWPCFEKGAFGSEELAQYLKNENLKQPIDRIILIGVCTDICVISNAMLIKAALPDCPVAVDPSACAGVTPESHETALRAMAACQIDILS